MKVALTQKSLSPIHLTGSALVAFLTLGHLLLDTFSGMFSALLPTLQWHLGISNTMVAMLVAAFAISASVMQPVFGALADRIGRRQVIASGIILDTLLLSLVGIAPNLLILTGLLLIGGLGSAAMHPTGTSIARQAVRKHEALAVSLYGAGGALGAAIGPLLALWIVSTLGLSGTPWLMIPGLLLGGLTYFLIPEEKTLRPRSETTGWKMSAQRLPLNIIRGPIGWLIIVGILSSLAAITFSSAIPLWLVREHGISMASPLIGWTLAAYALSAAGGEVVAGLVSKYLGGRIVASVSLLLSLPPLFTLFWVEPGTVVYFVLVGLAGALLHASLPLLIVSAQNLAPYAMTTASGLLLGFAPGSAGVLYIAIGYVQESWGLAQAMGLAYLALIPAAFLAFWSFSKGSVNQTDNAMGVETHGTCSCLQQFCLQLVGASV